MTLKQRICKLLDVKSIVTFALTGALVYLTVCDKITAETFIHIYLPVISFYFGTQQAKNANTKE